ncbi:MAG: LamG-like jellyroll fold domain-containing protein [Chloroflexota bacterium]
MKRIEQYSIKLYLTLGLAGLVLLYLWPSFAVAMPLTGQQRLEQAWKLAADIGVYKHRSEIVQTSHPTPRLENAGRSPKIEQMFTSGFMNIPEGEMRLTLEGMGNNQPALEMKVEAGKTYGRHEGTEEWAELDDASQIISSGGDPLGFLVAMENVQAADDSNQMHVAKSALDNDQPAGHFVSLNSHQRYTFDINGLKYAQYISDQLEAELRRKGALPTGLSLGMADQYVTMKAHGEIWLNEAGLPVRQVLHLEFPAGPNAYEWYEADIVTTFQGWNVDAVEQQSAWIIPHLIENPSILVRDPQSLLPDLPSIDQDTIQDVSIALGLSLLLAAFLLFVITHRHSQKMYAGLSLAVITSMLVTPLLQSHQIQAFSQGQHARQVELEQQQELARAAENLRIDMTESNFNPRIDPLASVVSTSNPRATLGSISPLDETAGGLFAPQLQPADFDCPNPVSATDCDGDGLTDQIEIIKLGTDPTDIDTDGDSISDKVEVEGFILNAQKWYLDPTSPDSNNDGVTDFIECSNLVDIAPNGDWPVAQLGTACENTDTDATPDVFDFDNDGDGVPDGVDAASRYAGAVTTNAQSHLLFNLNNVTTNKTLFVDFQIRPTDPDLLWQNNNVFDWPDNDKNGQVTRVFTTTFADVNNGSLPSLSNGDVTLTPMLQVKMPAPSANVANPTASLPISGTFTSVLTDWLDIDTLNDYAITINQDQTDSSLYAYVPLAQVTDQVGDTPVAWNARMVYRPTVATWGQDHEIKLIWFITALTDSCDTSGVANPNDTEAVRTWCNDLANWRTSERIIQTYYEDFNLTALTVTEDHGSKTSVIAQTDAVAAPYETELWQMVRGLQSTFVIGDLTDGVNRFKLEDIRTRFDKDTSILGPNDPDRWEIDTSKIIVQENSAVDQTAAAKYLQATLPSLLNTTYGTPHINTVVNLLFAREDTSRSVSLDETDAVSVNGNIITVDVSSGLVSTYASVNWAPYRYGGAMWNAYSPVDYAISELEPALQATLTLADLQAMVGTDTIDNENLSKQGAILFAQNYYLTVSSGLADIVELAGQVVSEDTINDSDFALNSASAISFVVADMVDLLATLVESERVLFSDGNIVANSNFRSTQLRSFMLENAAFGETKIATIIADGAGTVGGASLEWVSKKIYKKFFKFKKTTPTLGKYAKRAGTTLSVFATGLAVSSFFIKNDKSKRTALVTSTGITAGAELFGTYGAYSKLQRLNGLKNQPLDSIDAKSGVTVAKQTKAVKKVVKFSAGIGFLVEVGVAIGFLLITLKVDDIEPGSVQANLLISETIGQIVVAIITAVISITAIGAVIVGVFAIIDAIISFICGATNVSNVDVQRWVCGGFSGAIATGISYLIYDAYVPYNTNDSSRLAISFDTLGPINKTGNEGFIAGNTVKFTANVANTISLADPERVIIKTSYLKPGTTKLDRERLLDIGKTSAFDYQLNSFAVSENSDTGLNLGDTTWQGNTATFSTTLEIPITEGINSIPSVFLTEAYNLATIECWGFIGADENRTCDENKELEGVNNTPVGTILTFDVLPSTVSGLPNFFKNAKAQVDMDGDGLLNGVTDPDDTKWDTDGDGLSDFWEENTAGFDPQDPDSDDDGLFDYWEAFNRTRPDLQDTDSDGLQDQDEFFHPNVRTPYEPDNSTWTGGWTVVYDYDGSQSLQTLVSADPLDVDGDWDSILDNLERVYGYHPNVPSIRNVLTLETIKDGVTYLPGSTINYTATVKNELDNRVAFGLLEAEFPVDIVRQQQIINALYPQVETQINGAVTVPNTNQSQTQDLVVRAGALIETSAVDEVFVLPFNGAASIAFLDATSARHDFTCITCPTANGGTVTFNGSQTLTRLHDDDFDRSVFSLAAWVYPTARGGVLYNDLNDFSVAQLADGKVQVAVEGNTLTSVASLGLNSWNYLVVSYNAGNTTIFVNSVNSASGNLGAITPTNNGFEIGSGFQGDLDRIALHASELTQEDILDVFDGLTMYASFDDGVLQGNGGYCDFADAISQREFSCDVRAVRAERRVEDTYTTYIYLPSGSRIALPNFVFGTDTVFKPRPDVFDGVIGDSILLTRDNRSRDTDYSNDQERPDNYLHFNHQFNLAGTTPGVNNNAFSIALWLHPGDTTLPTVFGTAGGTLGFANEGAILTLPDQPGTGSGNTQNPTHFVNGDGSQVRVEALKFNRMRVKVGSCDTVLNDFFLNDGDITTKYPPGEERPFIKGPSDFWEHLVIAYNGQNSVNVYRNGQLAKTTACTNPGVSFQTVNGFTVGYSSLTNDIDTGVAVFRGSIDELRFYNRGFTAAEAEELYASTGVKLNFNGRTGQTFFANEAPSGIFGTCSGPSCPESGLPSIDNQGLRFDGGDYVDLSGTPEEIGVKDGSFTVMGWVKGSGTLFGIQPDGNNRWLYAGVTGNRPRIYWTGASGAQSSTGINTNQWNHIAFRYIENNTNSGFIGEVNVFVNGQLTATSTNNLPFRGEGGARIGASLAQNFNGMIDNVVVSPYALTSDEIKAFMNQAPALNLHLDEGLTNVLQTVTSFGDDGPYGLAATCSGNACPVAGSQGKMREAPVFDGNDLLTIPDNSALDLQAFSVGMWVKPQQEKNDYQPLIVKEADNGGTRNYGVYIAPNSMNAHYSLQQSNCSTYVAADSIGSLNKDQWNHVMMTFDGTAAKIYLNGSQQGSIDYSGTPCLNNHPVKIGNEVNAYTGFEGSLDEITLHNIALNAEEIQDLYTYQSSWFDTTVSQQVFVDADVPTVDLGPSGIFLNGDPRLLSFTAYDPGIGLASVSVEITDPQGGKTTQTPQRSIDLSSPTWFYSFTPTNAGRYWINVTATDGAGRVRTAGKSINVDLTAPSVRIQNRAYDGQTDTLILSGDTFDAAGYPIPESDVNIDTLSLEVADRFGNSIAGFIPINVIENPKGWDNWNINYPFPVIPYGIFNITTRGTDLAGNEGLSSGSTYYMDYIAPIGDMIIDTDVLDPQITTIEGTATDIGYNLTAIQTIMHFEEAANATRFIDGSPGQVVATCDMGRCPTAQRPIKYGKAVKFDGLDDYLSLGTTPAISGTKPFAVSAWLSPDTNSGERVIIQQRSANASDGKYQLSLNADGTVKWLVDDGNGASFEINSSTTIQQYYIPHILAVRDADGSGTLYINGVAEGTASSTPQALSEAPVFVGGDGIANDKFFSGNLDEVTIYDGAPSADEAYYMYTTTFSRISEILVRFRSYDERDIGEDEGIWYTAYNSTPDTLHFGKWSLTLPPLTPDRYKIDLKVKDSNGNQRYVADVWSGVYRSHDLQLSAVADVSAVEPGNQIVYTATYTNSATSVNTATNVSLTLSMPIDTSLNVGLSDPTWSCLPDDGVGFACTYSIGDLAPGDTGVITAIVDVSPNIASLSGNIADTFNLTSDGGEASLANNTVTVTTPLSGTLPNLVVTKMDNGGQDADGNVDYTIIISNTGNVAVTAIVTETVPNRMGVSNYRAYFRPDEIWDCDSSFGGGTCVTNAGVVTPGQSVSIPFNTYVSGELAEEVTITNTVQVAALEGGETSLNDNIFTLSTLLSGGAFGVLIPAVTVQEGSVITNTGPAVCLGACEAIIDLKSGPGQVAQYDPFTTPPSTDWDWTFTTTDGPDESANVVIEFALDGFPTNFGGDGSFSEFITFTLTVENVAPTIAITGSDTAEVNIPYTITLGSVIDPGIDTVTACTLNWDDGSSTDCLAAIGGGTVNHTYTTAVATRTITVDLTDEDGLHLAAGSKIVDFGPVVNEAPVFTAIPGQTVAEGQTVSFTAVATDTNNDTLTYSLIDGPVGATVDPSTGLFSWVTDESDGPNVYASIIQVSDGAISVTTTSLVTVTEVNLAPVFNAMSNPTMDELTTLNVTVAATDDDLPAQPLTYSLGNAPSGATIDPATGLFSWISMNEADGFGVYDATILVSDGVVTESKTIQIMVNEANIAPMLNPIPGVAVIAGDTVNFTATASDSDVPAQTLTYSLGDAPAGATLNPSSGLFNWGSAIDGLYLATVIVSDGILTDSQTVSIIVEPSSVAPTFFPFADQSVTEEVTATYTFEAYDANGDTLTFSLNNAPNGAVISPTTGTFTWGTDEADGPGMYPITVVASDGVLTNSIIFNVTVNEQNTPPIFFYIGDQRVDDGGTLNFTAVATDTDVPAQTLSYSLSNEPAGATIDPGSGLFTWVASGIGIYTPTIQASDGVVTTSRIVTLTVVASNSAPVLDPIGNQTVDEGAIVSFTAVATDDDIPAQTLTFSMSNAPDGATIDAANGLFSWQTIESDGPSIYSPTIVVSDGVISTSQIVAITVNEVNEAPVLTTIGNKSILEGNVLSFTAVATDTDVPTQTLTFSLNGEPTGATINSINGEFSWLTDVDDGPAVYTITIIVSDGIVTDSETINITVSETPEAPVITPVTPLVVNETEQITFTVVATDANGDMLRYGLADGVSGMSLDANSGLFSWTPDESQGPSTVIVTIVVTDTTNLTDSTTITITVHEVNQAPVLGAISDATISVGEPFSLTLVASDADIPANGLTLGMIDAPLGATLDANSGLFSWTPDVSQGPGQYSLTFSVSDNGSPVLSDSKIITLTVINAPSILIDDVTVDEAVGTVNVTVTLTSPSALPVSVNYTITDGTATGSGTDYAASNGTLTWASGTFGPQIIPIAITSDNLDEPDETVNISLSGAVNANISVGNALLTITDDDIAPVLSISKSVDAGQTPVQPDTVIVYTIVVANNGGDANGVVISDILPDYIGGSDLNEIVDIAANTNVTFTINAVVAQDAPAGQTITNTAGFSHTSGIGQAVAAITIDDAGEPTQPLVYVSTSRNGIVDGFIFADEDILVFDPNTNSWDKFFDGSDVGLSRVDLDAFAILADGHLLLSPDRPRWLKNVGWIDDSDIVRFVPTSLGETTAGTFDYYFDGSDVGLTRGSEDIDAISVMPNGDLLLSTIGNFYVPGVGGRDEDLILFTPTDLGRTTRGTWSRYFDGSDVGLRSGGEDIRGGQIDEIGDNIYLTTQSRFSVPGLNGQGTDIFVCTPNSLGTNTNCTFSIYWQGEDYGLTKDVDAFAIGGQPSLNLAEIANNFSVTEVELADVPEEEDVQADTVADEDDPESSHNQDDISMGSDTETTIFLPLLVKTSGTFELAIIQPVPDVIVDGIDLTHIAGNRYTITIVALNGSDAVIGRDSHFFIHAYLSSDLENPIVVCPIQDTEFSPGESRACTGEYAFSNGMDVLRGWVDPYNELVEANETNNIYEAEFIALE